MENAKECLKNFIRTKVKEEESTGRKLLLSNLGSKINTQDQGLRDALGENSLSFFIKSEMRDEFKIESMPHSPLARILLPISQETTKQLSNINNSTSSKKVRYDKIVWLAFTQPLVDDKRRYLHLSSPQYFVDKSAPVGDITQWREIPKASITTKTSDIENNDFYLNVHQKIQQWLDHEKIDPAAVIFNATRKTNKQSLYSAPSPLELIFSKLSEEDLKRITIPLDIVAKLMGK